MFDTFLSALTAAGGNSRAARSARAKLQFRDRYGRWIEMGRGVKFKVRGADGAPRSVIGSFVGAKDANTGQVYVAQDPNGLPDGFYDVTSDNAQEFVANLSEDQLAQKGIEVGKDANGQPVGERAAEAIPNINEMSAHPAPEGWVAQPGTYGGKKVIQTDDGDFRIHFGGKDESVLLEDHRGAPGQAEPQRSIAEAFKKVGDVDLQREEAGDQAYVGLGSEEENAATLAARDRDSKIEQIKGNERTLANDKAPLGAKQTAMNANQAIMKELEESGAPYDPEGNDSDEALAARKAAPEGAPAAPDAATPETSDTPLTTITDIDTTTFDVAQEGFLVPTGKSTNDISPEGLANFMTAEKEQLGKGGARLVIDTDAGTAEIHNSADTLENAQAQAGGLGQDRVLDLVGGKEISVNDKEAVDPNSPDVNPNLSGDTSPEAPNAQDSNPDAVEPGGAGTGADAPASPAANGENERNASPGAGDPGNAGSPEAPAGADGDGAEGGTERADSAEPAPSSSAPGSVEELEERRNKTKAALETAGAPEDIIALNEQMDELDTRLAAERSSAPDETEEADAPETPEAESDAPEEPEAAEPEAEEAPEKSPLLDRIQEAFDKTDPFSDSNVERRERAALRMLRDAERNGDVQKGVKRLSQEEKDSLSDELAEELGIREARAPEPAPEPEAPEEAPEAPAEDEVDEEATPSEPPAELAPSRVPAGRKSPETWEPVDNTPPAPQPRVEEPGNAEAATAARSELDAIDAEIENELTLAENSADAQEQATHLSRVRTLERQRKIQENALNRALGNAPMDLNKDLGWKMTDPENRGSLPEAPTPTPEPEEAPEADTPAVLDETITPDVPVALEDISPSAIREGDYIQHPVTGNIVRVETIDAEWDDAENVMRYDISYSSRNAEEEAENEAEGLVRIFGGDNLNTYRGWRDTPQDPAGDPEPEGPPATFEEARERYDQATADYFDILMKDDYTEDEYEEAEARREEARADMLALEPEEPEAPEEEESDADRRAAAAEREFREEGPVTDEEIEQLIESQRIADEVAARDAVEANVSTEDGLGGLYDGGDDPYDVESGNENKAAAAKAKMQGKEMSEEERAQYEDILDAPLSDNQVARVLADIDAMPNRPNTRTIARPEKEQPEYLSTADVDIVNAERDDPNFVFDEDLTWRRVREEFPNATELENGDLILDTVDNKGKRYDAMLRRTAKNRFLVYVMETDGNGNRRAKRIGNTEWHSYEALEKRIQQSRALINSKSPAGSLARRKDQPTENLGTQGFPSDDFIGDIGNPNAAVPATGDEKFDRLLEVAAAHIRNADVDLNGLRAALEDVDPGANAINTIMQAIIGRAQDNYRPDGPNPWQLYDGETATPGMHVDWTDWHQEKDWWLPNGQLNPNRRVNERYGQVNRGIVMGYVKENSDGKGHTYGDHVWVQFVDGQGRPIGTWVKRSAQTLRLAEANTAPGLPFFSKREEWRTSPEALARRFGVPQVAPEEPVQTKARPAGELPKSRRLRFTSRGNLSGYSNVPVPSSQQEIMGMLLAEEIRPQFRPASEARPGMMIVRMDDDGKQWVDSIIRVENIGNGSYRIHAARPNGSGVADVDSFVVSGDADLPLMTSPGFPEPKKPEPTNERQGELVQFTRDGVPIEGVIVHDDGDGNVMVSTPSGEVIDILESNIEPVDSPEVSTEERQDLVDALNDHQIPKYIRDLIMQGILSPGLSADRYKQLVEIIESFAAHTGTSRQIGQILDMIGATDQQRADVTEFFAETED